MVALTQFGARCREHRSVRQLTMLDQAQAFGCTVSEISAIDTGSVAATSEYAIKLAKWLQLSANDERELVSMASSRSNILRFRAKNEGIITHKLFRKINKLSPNEIRGIGKSPPRNPPDDR